MSASQFPAARHSMSSESDLQSSSSLGDGRESIWSETRIQDHIAQVDPHIPSTFGGVSKGIAAGEFKLAAPPDVTRLTRIIGLCGVDDSDVDQNDPNTEGKASPAYDGWFFSDFFMWMHLLRGTGASQKWIMSSDATPKKLLDKYLPKYNPGYLHGKSNTTRKIVLDPSLVQSLPDITTSHRKSLLPFFLQALREESKLAKDKNQSLLILVFGHGQSGPGIYVGSRKPKDCRHVRLTPAALREVLEPNTHTTLITTACFSGGFCCDPQLNITVFAAGGPAKQSLSWPQSQSLGRACGSIFTSTILEALKGEGNPRHSLLKENVPLQPPSNDSQKKSLAQFDALVYTTLFTESLGGGLAHTQDIRFSAQDDDWEQNWTRRTGLPLVDFKLRYDALKDYSTPQLSSDNTSAFSGGSRLGIWDHRQSLYRRVREQARSYMECFPDPDNTAANIWLHKSIRKLFEDDQTDDLQLQSIWDILEYRSSIMKWARSLVKMSTVKLPQGLECEEFNFDEWRKVHLDLNTSKWNALWNMVVGAQLFPEPYYYQGRDFSFRGLRYLAAALYETADNSARALEIVSWWKYLRDKTIEHQVNQLRQSNTIRTTAAGLFRSVGRTIRDLSPSRKRLSQPRLPMPLSRDVAPDPRGKRQSTGSVVPHLPPPESGQQLPSRRRAMSDLMKDLTIGKRSSRGPTEDKQHGEGFGLP